MKLKVLHPLPAAFALLGVLIVAVSLVAWSPSRASVLDFLEHKAQSPPPSATAVAAEARNPAPALGPTQAANYRAIVQQYGPAMMGVTVEGSRKITFARVKIVDRRGHAVLDAKAGGPFMLVDLSPGRYSIQATLAGQTLRKSHLRLTDGKTAHATFEFPTSTDDWLPVRTASADLESPPYNADWLQVGPGG